MERTRSIYLDKASWERPVQVDDFLVAIGKRQSNSVYHVLQVRSAPRPGLRAVRYYLQVFHSDLLTALRRSPAQYLHTIRWYSR